MSGEMAMEGTLRRTLAHAPEDVVAAYLFGSRARGTARDDSDVDLAVLYRVSPPSGFDGLGLDLESELEKALGRRVQVVVLNVAPVDLVHRVLRDGRLLLERDRSARVRFEVAARREYLDLAPVLRRYRRAREALR